jgi:urease accessory protein
MKISKNILATIAILSTFIPTITFAHNSEHNSGLIYGLQHPITGLDHIIAMIAVGLIAFMVGGKSKFLLPIMFVSTMIIGSILGGSGINIPFIDQGILVSDIILGAVLLFALRIPNLISYSLIGVFAIFHGFAHGAEVPNGVNGITYGIGFVTTTIGLHILGMITGYIAQNYELKTQKLIYRIAGLLVLLASTFLLYK